MENDCKKYLSRGSLNCIIVMWSDKGARAPWPPLVPHLPLISQGQSWAARQVLILQPFRHFTYVTAHSPIIPSFHVRYSSFSNTSVILPTSQLILQPFRCFTYITAHPPTILSLLLRHSSFSNHSVVLPTSQPILQPFRCFTYITAHSPTILSLLLRHKLSIYITWRSAHEVN